MRTSRTPPIGIEAGKPLPFSGGVGVWPVEDRCALRTAPTPDPFPEGKGGGGRPPRRRMSPKPPALLALALLAACHQPTFDERYAKAEKEIRASEASIDKELADKASEAAAGAEAAPTETASGRP